MQTAVLHCVKQKRKHNWKKKNQSCFLESDGSLSTAFDRKRIWH